MTKTGPVPHHGAIEISDSIGTPQSSPIKNVFEDKARIGDIAKSHRFGYFARDNIVNANGDTISLSERELQILMTLNADTQSKAIAFNLGISINTLNQHLRSIYQKLGTHSRMGAVIIANKNKLYDAKP